MTHPEIQTTDHETPQEWQELAPLINQAALESVLRDNDVPIDKWLELQAKKTTEDLWDEIQEGETELWITPSGGLCRVVKVVGLDVYHRTASGVLKLREARQILVTGRVLERDLTTSLAEKIKGGEDLVSAAHRALKEETGILDALSMTLLRKELFPHTSGSYPKLETYCDATFFEAWIGSADYKPNGYQEEQPRKTVEFEWDKYPEPLA